MVSRRLLIDIEPELYQLLLVCSTFAQPTSQIMRLAIATMLLEYSIIGSAARTRDILHIDPHLWGLEVHVQRQSKAQGRQQWSQFRPTARPQIAIHLHQERLLPKSTKPVVSKEPCIPH